VTELAPGGDRIGTGTGDKSGTGLVTELAPPTDTKSKLLNKPKETLKKHTKETGVETTPPIKRGTKKKKYFFDNILLSQDEYQKLVAEFGEAGTRDRLEALSLYKKSKGKRYKDDYATVLGWERRDQRMRGDRDGTHKRSPGKLIPRDQYHRPEDY